MRVRLLPSHFEAPNTFQNLTTIVVNDVLAIDGGSLGLALPPDQQVKVREVVITHEHMDHIATLPLFLSEVFPFLEEPLRLYGSRTVLKSLKAHIFNDLIWPRFDRIDLLNGKGQGLEYVEIKDGKPFKAGGLTITPVRTSHIIPTQALVVEDGAATFVFSSDTYKTDDLWKECNKRANVRAIFIDVSYPNDMEGLAEAARHLTPRSLGDELKKLDDKKVKVLALHLKPQYRERILSELADLRMARVGVVEIGKTYDF
jgi:ribonuclease BN (tRNA processing enzyme)